MSRSFSRSAWLMVRFTEGGVCSFDLVRVAFDAVRGIFGWVLVLVGAVWVGQGIGLIPGSFMTGSTFWAFAGGVSIVVGAALVAWGRKGKGP